jgi:hypothetical protein
LLLAGDYGSGKTTVAASAQHHPDLADVLFLKVEDGIVSADHVEGILAVNTPTPLHVQATVNDLLKPPAQRPALLKTVKTVVIDSVSKLKDKTLNMMAEDAALKGKREESYINEIQDYGRSTVFISNMVDAIMQTGMNVILISGIDEVKTGNVTTEIKPLLNAKLMKSLAHMMHFVWYMKEHEGRFFLKVLPGGVYRVKTRNPYFVKTLQTITKDGWYEIPSTDVLPGYEFPTIPTLFNLYLNSKPE